MIIYKYHITITDTQTVQLPEGAFILSVAYQGPQLCLWALVNPEKKVYPRTLEIFGTGHPMNSNYRKYICTVQDGSFVWHIFDSSTY